MKLLSKIKVEVVNDSDYEKCVICHNITDVKEELNIQYRRYYIVGVGQLCDKCYQDIYNKNIKK